jgi:integrase
MHGDGNGIRLVNYRGWWCVYWRETGESGKTVPRRSSLRTQDLSEARRRFKDFLKSAQTPSDNLAEIFASYRTEKNITDKHHRSAYAWKHLAPRFSDLRPDQVSKAECRAYIQKRRDQGAGDGTIRKELTLLRAAINLHDKHTRAEFELPPRPAPSEKFLTRKEYDQLLKGAKSPHIRLFIILALATAGRMSAILDLTWDRVDLERGIIRLALAGEERRKGRATVPMTGAARAALEEAKKASLSDYVIEYGGGKVASVARGIREAADRAGLKGVSAHVLRHTSAVWMAESNVPMSVIAQYLGHTDSRITEHVYARYSPEFLAVAASALETLPNTGKKSSRPAARKSQKRGRSRVFK